MLSKTQTLTATLLQPCTLRHERKRGSAVTTAGKASEQHALLHGCSQASSSASKLILCQRKLPKHAKTCQNMPPQCSCLSMHKTVKVCEKLSSRKSFLKEARNSTVARESLRANKRSSTFHSFRLMPTAWLFARAVSAFSATVPVPQRSCNNGTRTRSAMPKHMFTA